MNVKVKTSDTEFEGTIVSSFALEMRLRARQSDNFMISKLEKRALASVCMQRGPLRKLNISNGENMR